MSFELRHPLQQTKKNRWPLLSVSFAIHAGLIFLVTQVATTMKEPVTIEPMMVTISPSDPTPTPPEPEPPKPMLPDVIVPQVAPITISEPVAPPPVETAKSTQDVQPPAVTPPNFDAAYLRNPAPVYPNLSRRLRETGTVQLRVHVSSTGQPMEIQIAKSCGFPRLDEAALTAVRQWRFEPAMERGGAVEAWVVVPVEFSLEKARK